MAIEIEVSKRKALLKRSVSARLVERFIFNFRLSPRALESKLPVRWLKPQVINGHSVVSFCILKLQGLMLSPLTPFFGLDTVSCAYRCGVIDMSEATPGPSVFILGRNTDLPIIARLGPVIFKNAMPRVRTAITHGPKSVDIYASFLDGRRLFSARVRPSKSPKMLDSQVFGSLEAFVEFIHDGSSSYAPSVVDNYYSRVDLFKEDSSYESMDAIVDCNWLDSVWSDAGLVFDSAVRAGGGGLYKWTYLGQYSKQMGIGQISVVRDPTIVQNRVLLRR
jgi:hypothetical protein